MTAFLGFELRRTARDVRFLFFLIAFPVLLYLIESGTAGRGDPHFATRFLASMGVWSVMGAGMWASGPQLCRERGSGWIRQLRVTPLSDGAWLATKLAQGCLMAVPGVVLLGVTAVLKEHVHVSAGAWAALLVLFVAGAVPFVFAGLIIGLRLDAQTGQVAQMMVLIVMAFLGGIFLPLSIMPDALRDVARALPSYRLASTGWDIVDGHALRLDNAAVLVAWTAVLAVAAVWLWRRESSTG
ncbi:MAG TPA: ABC transporter permease [Streptosporangiaceae bacterium]|jgi:ABC-2 type transport system permease protein